MTRPCVLVVEDNPETQKALQRDISALGVDVDVCTTAEEAGEKLEKGLSVQAIILDFMLPGQDGPTFYRNLSQNDKFKNIPVVPFTSLVSQQRLGGLTIVETFVRSRGDLGGGDVSTSMVGKGRSEAVSEAPPALILALAHALQKNQVPLPDPFRERLRTIARSLAGES